jgi:hypothetical protein
MGPRLVVVYLSLLVYTAAAASGKETRSDPAHHLGLCICFTCMETAPGRLFYSLFMMIDTAGHQLQGQWWAVLWCICEHSICSQLRLLPCTLPAGPSWSVGRSPPGPLPLFAHPAYSGSCWVAGPVATEANLRTAVAAGGAITLAAPITLTSGELVLTSVLSIDGAGQTINAAGTSRIFNVRPGGSLYANDLILTNARVSPNAFCLT